MKRLLNIAAPVLAAFTLAACATQQQKQLSEEAENAAVGLTATLALQDDFDMVAACRGEGRAGVLSYSESRDEYLLSLLEGNKVTTSVSKPDPANPEAQMNQLDKHCFPG